MADLGDPEERRRIEDAAVRQGGRAFLKLLFVLKVAGLLSVPIWLLLLAFEFRR